METKTPTCQNCEKPYEEGFEFCPHCGQKTNENLTIGVLFYNTISNYFSFDARFLKSFIPLMFRPGYLARKFLEGKRLLFLHPAQMYLFISVIFFFIFSFSTREIVKDADKLNDQVTNSDIVGKALDSINVDTQRLDSITKGKVLKSLKENKSLLGLTDEDLKKSDSIFSVINENNGGPNFTWNYDGNEKIVDSLIAIGAGDRMIMEAMGMDEEAEKGDFSYNFFRKMLNLRTGKETLGSIVQAFFDTIPIAMFFLLPLFALILKLFYFRRGTYAYHLVFSFYFFSFLFTVFTLLLGIDLIIDFISNNQETIENASIESENENGIPGWIIAVVVLSTYMYFYLALLNFYGRNWFFTLIKSGIITFVFLLMVLPLAFVLIASFAVISS